MSNPEPHQPTAEEVQDFIRGRSVPAPPGPLRPPGVSDPTSPPVIPQVSQDLGQLSPEAEEFIKSTAVARSVPADEAPKGAPTEELPVESEKDERIDTEISPLTDPAAPSMQNNQWVYSDAMLGDVKVSDFERTLYLKAAMNDTPVILDITLGQPGGASVRVKVRSLSHYEIDTIYRAVRQQIEDGVIMVDEMKRVDAMQLNSWIQWYSACLQVVECQGKGLDSLSFNSTESTGIEVDAQRIRDHYRLKHREIQAPRWHAMLMAMRLFETKVKICNDSLANGNFWNPASGG
jgi:hypothetical protein